MTLQADVEEAAPLDRLLLALGGEAWLRRCFVRVLAQLAEVLKTDAGIALVVPSA